MEVFGVKTEKIGRTGKEFLRVRTGNQVLLVPGCSYARVCTRIMERSKKPGGVGRALGGAGVGVVGVQLAEEAGEAEAYRPEASCRVEG